MTRSSVEPKTRKYVKWYEFLSFARYQSDKYGTELLDTATRTGLYALKSASKKGVDRVAEATGAFIGNKIVDKIVKPKPVTDKNSRKLKKYLFHQRKKEKIERLKTSIKNMKHYKISKTLNNLIVLNFVTDNGLK